MVFAVLILWQHTLAECNAKTLGVDFLDTLNDLEQTGTAAQAVGLERGRDGQADGLFGAAFVGDDQIGGQRIEAALYALRRGVEGLQVNGDICSLHLPFPSIRNNVRSYYNVKKKKNQYVCSYYCAAKCEREGKGRIGRAARWK